MVQEEVSKLADLDDEIRRVEDLRFVLKGIENPLSGHYALTESPDSGLSGLMDEDLYYGSKQTAARRRQEFYRRMGMRVKAGEELEISLGIVGDRVSKQITASQSATACTVRTGAATSAAEKSTTIPGLSSPPRPRSARSR